MELVEFFTNQLKLVNEEYANKTRFFQELAFQIETENEENVVITLMQGLQFQNASQVPFLIEVYTTKLFDAFKVWANVIKNMSDKEFTEGESKFYFRMATPTVSQKFLDTEGNYAEIVSIFGTITEMRNGDDLATCEIDGELMDVKQWAIVSASGVDSEQNSADFVNKSTVINTANTFRFTFNQLNDTLNLKLYNVRKGIISPNTSFTLKLTWSSGLVETHIVKIPTHSISGEYGAVPSRTVDFIN